MEIPTTTIEMTTDVHDALVIMAGYAAGAAMKAGDRELAQSFLNLSAKVFGGTPTVV
jgi:hypothetical protein